MKQLKQVGFWKQKEDSTENLPWPTVRKYPKETKDKVVAYLESGEEWAHAKGMSTCRLCGMSNGSCDVTDGKFNWPEGYVHYVRDHNVMVDSELLAHILTRP